MENLRCTYCQNPIETVRIRCAECQEFDLCLQCFALGAESGPHKKDHEYHVLDGGHFELFDSGQSGSSWTAREEDILLETIEHYGFGNWDDVGTKVETKTSEECREHYYAYYINGNIGKATFPLDFKTHIVTDHSCAEGGPLSPTLTAPIPPVDLTPLEQHELGYMPLRDDFEREYDNASESLVSGLAINYDDEDLDLDFKVAQVDMYRYRLRERDRRKRLAREYGLLNQATTLGMKKAQKKKLSKEEKEIQDKMKVFSQFHSSKEHEAFFENLRKEKQIKSRIKELMRYRRNGIKKLHEIPEHESEKTRRDRRKEYKKKMVNSQMVKRNSMGIKKEKDGESIEDTTDDRSIGVSGKQDMLVTLPGGDLLSEREKKLCNSMGMKPASYTTIKTCIVRDYLQRRQGINVKIRYPTHLDKTYRRRILNFLNENGWLGGVGLA